MVKKISESKTVYMVFSIVVALFLWMYVTNDLNPDQTATIYNVPVVFTGVEALEERGLMISAGLDQTVTINIQAKRDVIQQLDNDTVSVVIDVSSITETGEISVTEYTPTFPKEVSSDPITIRSRTPSAIQYTVSKLVEREIEVRASFTGSIAEGFQMGDLQVEPATITIRGREELVNQVDYARVTLSQDELAETYTGELPFVLMGYTGEAINEPEIEISATTVMVTLPVVSLKEIPLTVEFIDGGGASFDEGHVSYSISPESIMVSGHEDDLEPLSEITLGSIELSKIFNSDKYTFKIPLAEELTNVSGISEATVTVSIVGLTTRTIETDDIELINIPEGYDAVAVTESRSVMIRGDAEDVEQVISSQVRIVANLENAIEATGSQTIPVTVYLDGSSDVGVVGEDYSIVVSITVSEEE